MLQDIGRRTKLHAFTRFAMVQSPKSKAVAKLSPERIVDQSTCFRKKKKKKNEAIIDRHHLDSDGTN
jgi:hypothetical protein